MEMSVYGATKHYKNNYHIYIDMFTSTVQTDCRARFDDCLNKAYFTRRSNQNKNFSWHVDKEANGLSGIRPHFIYAECL